MNVRSRYRSKPRSRRRLARLGRHSPEFGRRGLFEHRNGYRRCRACGPIARNIRTAVTTSQAKNVITGDQNARKPLQANGPERVKERDGAALEHQRGPRGRRREK